jgi:hypothetical protein
MKNTALIDNAPEMLEQLKQVSFCFRGLLKHPEATPIKGGWMPEKLQEWKHELDELIAKAEGK